MRFLDLPNCPPDKADVIILPVAYDRTVTYNKGTAQGPAAILAASEQLEFFEEDMQWSPARHMKFCVLPQITDNPALSEEQFHAQLHDSVQPLKQRALFIGLGGEHSITPAMVQARMPAGGTVVQIDAHADFRSSYHGSIYNHACPMYRLRQMNYELIQIGIRSLNETEAEAIKSDNKVTTYFDRELHTTDSFNKLLKQLAQLHGDVWLTIDFDGFDPTLFAGVGTPQPGGLNWHQGLDILQTLTTNNNIRLCGIDLLEMIPEPSCVSDMTAAKFVQKAFSYWGKAQGFDKQPATGSQTGINDE